jgi:hypothetical protein
MFSNLKKNHSVCEITCRGGQATDDNIVHVHCMLDMEEYKHKHTQNM